MIAILSPPISVAADLWGRKWILVGLTLSGVVCIMLPSTADLIILQVGCIITGSAHSMAVVLVGQVFSGIGCSSQLLCTAIPSETLPRRYRTLAQAGANMALALASVVALLAGGALLRNNDFLNYRALFYMNAGFFGVGVLTIAALYTPPPRETQIAYTLTQKLAKLDWIGMFLLSSGLVLFSIGLVWSLNPYSWRNAHVLAPFIIGCVLLIGLAVYESLLKQDGMFNHALFERGRNFKLAIGCIFAEGLAFFATNNYYAYEVSTLFEHDTFLVGVRFSICFFTFMISTIFTGLYCTYTKQLRYPAVLGFGAFMTGFICMATANLGSNIALWGYGVFFGCGLGVCLNVLMTAAQFGTPPELIASASGIIIGVRSVGGSVALAIFNAIFSQQLSSNLNSKVPAAVLPLGLPTTSLGPLVGMLTSGQIEGASLIPGATESIILAAEDAVLHSFIPAFRYVWVAAACFCFVAMIAAFFIHDPKMEFNELLDAALEVRKVSDKNKSQSA